MSVRGLHHVKRSSHSRTVRFFTAMTCHLLGLLQGGGGDGIEARRQSRQRIQQSLQRRCAAGVLPQQVQQRGRAVPDLHRKLYSRQIEVFAIR